MCNEFMFHNAEILLLSVCIIKVPVNFKLNSKLVGTLIITVNYRELGSMKKLNTKIPC